MDVPNKALTWGFSSPSIGVEVFEEVNVVVRISTDVDGGLEGERRINGAGVEVEVEMEG